MKRTILAVVLVLGIAGGSAGCGDAAEDNITRPVSSAEDTADAATERHSEIESRYGGSIEP